MFAGKGRLKVVQALMIAGALLEVRDDENRAKGVSNYKSQGSLFWSRV